MFWKFVTGDTKSSSPASNSALRAIGSNDGKMYFINESTHALDFAVQTGGPAQSSATFVGRVAYFGGNDTNVYAVYTTSGKRLWTFKTGAAIVATPIFYNGVV